METNLVASRELHLRVEKEIDELLAHGDLKFDTLKNQLETITNRQESILKLMICAGYVKEGEEQNHLYKILAQRMAACTAEEDTNFLTYLFSVITEEIECTMCDLAEHITGQRKLNPIPLRNCLEELRSLQLSAPFEKRLKEKKPVTA